MNRYGFSPATHPPIPRTSVRQASPVRTCPHCGIAMWATEHARYCRMGEDHTSVGLILLRVAAMAGILLGGFAFWWLVWAIFAPAGQ